jgi:hypothetical protein
MLEGPATGARLTQHLNLQEGGDSSMDIGSSFTYMFEDENWIKKIVIGGIVAIIPIVNFAAFGYLIQVIRNIRDGHPTPLPEWDQFGAYFMDGLWIFLIVLVYLIPVILLSCIQGVGTAALANNQNQDAQGAVGILSFCFSCLIGLWSLVVAILIPAVMIRYAEVGEFMAGFRFGEIFSVITANVGSYVIVLLLMWVASFVGQLGIILCVIGVIFTSFWSYLVGGNLLGQLAAQIRQNQPSV